MCNPRRLAVPATLIFIAALAGCSSDNVTLAPQRAATAAPTAKPTTAPTTAPTTTPTTTPSASPSASPTASSTPGVITLNPTSVLISAVGSGCVTTATFTASETGYTGNFTAVSANTAIATVSPAQSTSTFTVTATTTTNGGPGTTIAVTDTKGNSATETVNVATCLP